MTASDGTRHANEVQPAPTTGDVVTLPYQLLLLVSEQSPSWYRDYHARVRTTLPTVHTCDDPGRFAKAIEDYKPDAVLGCADDACLGFFRAQIATEDFRRPLCVLVESEDPGPDADLPADVVLPPSLGALRHQLRTCLSLRADARAHADARRAIETDLAQKQKALEQSRRAVAEVTLLKEAIAANVRHELNTPILHLKGAISLLAEENAPSKLIDYAKQATARVESVVLNISQLASSLEINVQPLIVREILDQAERSLRRSWTHKDNVERLRFHVAERLPPVLGDRQGLVTVVQHLVDNALKFSKGPVDVYARRDQNRVSISVKDYGIGMSQDEIDRIFDMFFQVDSGTSRRFPGTGAGLAIVRVILDKHDIEIKVTSAPDTGSTFMFWLDVADLSADPQTA